MIGIKFNDWDITWNTITRFPGGVFQFCVLFSTTTFFSYFIIDYNIMLNELSFDKNNEI